MLNIKYFVMHLAIASTSLLFAQTPAPLAMVAGPGRIAISHDGNNWDKDDVYSLAMDYGVLTAFGVQRKLVHMEHSTIFCSNPTFQAEIRTSANGITRFPGFDSSVVYDAYANKAATIAHFKAVAEKSTAKNRLYYIVGGPMEIPWQNINAVSKRKRKFITVISSSNANENMGACIDPSHKYSDLQTSFGPNGVVFVKISDQNANLGGVGSTKWDWLSSMPANPLFPTEAARWLRTRDFKQNGDVSETGMTWYVLTGMTNAKAADFELRFKNPLPRLTQGGAKKSGASEFDIDLTEEANIMQNSVSAKYQQNTKSLEIRINEFKSTGSVIMYNVRSEQIHKFSLVSGNVGFNLGGTPPGKYFLNIRYNGQSTVKEILIK